MLRYKLDDLGWYQFEWLIQSLLKAELGLEVQSWGGNGDQGRDSYCPDPLNFPSIQNPSPGPFLFQVKFVEAANSAQAKPQLPLTNAVRKELQQYLKFPRTRPAHYVICTNVNLDSGLREKIEELIRESLPSTKPNILGGKDVCDMLDRHPQLRRAFPQLLSLRDLDELIREAVDYECLERSRSAIRSARDIVPVFVPTAAYEKAWRILRSKNFVVLEGPPEVGKTAIAWMIALAQLSLGWQSLVCDEPNDFFRLYSSEKEQVFIADDAFGRTEYDPARGTKWETQLNRVYRELDAKHWLIWTSRKHILESAIKKMDLQGEARTFPSPGTVLVRASELNVKEKALILYRHARIAGLEEFAKQIVRKHLYSILEDPDFTPERIRRFVSKNLPEIANQAASAHADDAFIKRKIRDAIRNATDQMRKTFRALPEPHKWFLISMLESDRLAKIEEVWTSYKQHCPIESQGKAPPDTVLQELTEAFIKRLTQPGDSTERLDWIHPSYRDLVIEELSSDVSLQRQFLENVSLPGIKLALSEAGGTLGTREFPLLSDPTNWDILERRCLLLIEQREQFQAADLMETLYAALNLAGAPHTLTSLQRIAGEVCEGTRKWWDDEEKNISSYELRAYLKLSIMIFPLPKVPNLKPSWDVKTARLNEEIRSAFIDPQILSDWVDLLRHAREAEPRFLQQVDFPNSQTSMLAELTSKITEDIENPFSANFSSSYEEEASRLSSLAENLERLGEMIGDSADPLRDLAASVQESAELLTDTAKDLAKEESEEEPPEREEGEIGPTDYFDAAALFSDL